MRRHHLIALGLLAALAAAITALAIAAGPRTALLSAIVGIVVALWRVAAGYSRRTYPFRPCLGCKGSGKDFEPRWLAWASGRTHRAWRDCLACGGSGKRDRRGR